VRELEWLVVVKRADDPPVLQGELHLVEPVDGVPICRANQDYAVWVAASNGLDPLGKCLLPALVVELAVRLVQQLEHQAPGLLLIAQRDLFPEFHRRGRFWTGAWFISS
jgi:hypothetical protein